MTAFTSSQRPVHGWTRLYWPTALVVALLAFFIPYLSGAPLAVTGVCLAAGALILGIPELACLLSGNDQDTLSDWVWRSLHVVHDAPVNKWDAAMFPPLGGYLLVVGAVQDFLFNLAQAHWQFWLLFAAGCYFFGVWLLLHFFERWWT
jgi:hypothetical protein